MIRLSLASHWHWTQREDCAVTNISVAYWRTSRIYAVLGQAENARRYAEMCLEPVRGTMSHRSISDMRMRQWPGLSSLPGTESRWSSILGKRKE
jgi:hypothetical protein